MIAPAPSRTSAVTPELRALLMTVRQALLMLVGGIELYLGIASKH